MIGAIAGGIGGKLLGGVLGGAGGAGGGGLLEGIGGLVSKLAGGASEETQEAGGAEGAKKAGEPPMGNILGSLVGGFLGM